MKVQGSKHAAICVAIAMFAAATVGRSEPQTPVVDEQFVPPSVKVSAAAQYPPELADKNRTATVLLELTLDTQGVVGQVRIVQSAGPEFDAAATAAARKLVWEPATRAGKAVPVRVQYRFQFAPEVVAEPRDAAPSLGRYDRRDLEAAPVGFSSLFGTLRERGTGAPVVGALIVATHLVNKTAAEVVSDADGRFRFGLLSAGQYGVYLSGGEHKELRVQAAVADGAGTALDLRPERVRYGGYRATAEGPPNPGEMTRHAVAAEEIQKIPGVYGDALKVVQNLPGVARPSPISGDIVVRGSAPADTIVAIEAVRVPLLYHFGGLYSVVNTDLLDGVDFMPGGYPVSWGRQTGGVLNARLRAPQQSEKLSGYIETNVFHTGFFLKGPLGDNTNFTLAARRSYIDVLLNALLPAGTLPFTVAPRYYDFQAKVDHRFSSLTSMSILGFGSNDALSLVTTGIADGGGEFNGKIATVTKFNGLIGILRHDGGAWTARTTLGSVLAQSDTEIGSFLRFSANSLELTLRQDFILGKGPWQNRFGADIHHNLVWYQAYAPIGRTTEEGPQQDDNQPVQKVYLDGSYVHFSPSLWYDSVLQPHEKLQIVPGLRLDLYRGLGHDLTLLPRLNARWQQNKQLVLKGAVGMGSQRPQPYNLLAPFGNPLLSTHRSFEVAGGFEFHLDDKNDIDIQVFHKRLWDLVVQTPGPVPEVPYQNSGTGSVVGLELLARHKLSANWFGWLAYTLQKATRIDEPGGAVRLFDWDQTHIITALASYKLPRNWEVGFRFRLVTGNPYTPIGASVWNEKDDSFVGINSACINCARLPAFHQLDLRVDKKFVMDNFMLNVYLDVQNVYNRRNPEDLNYNYDFSKHDYLAGLPIIPSLGFRGEF